MSHQGDSISRNASFALAVRILSAAFTAVLTIFLVRYLGPTEYGALALAMSVGYLVFIPSDVGIAQATARYVAEAGADRRLVAAIISDSVRLKAVVSGAFSLCLIVLAGPIANAYDAPEIAWPLRVLAISIVFQSFVVLYAGIFQALGRVSVYLRVITVESVSETSLSIGIVLLGGGVTGAVAGRAAAYALAAGIGLALVTRTIRPGRLSLRYGSQAGHLRRIMVYGSALLVIEGAFALFSRIDALLIGAIISVRAVGLFEAPAQAIAFLSFLGQAVSAGVAPRMARTEGREPNIDALERGLRLMVVFQCVFLAPLLVWATPITELVLGPDYGESADVLRALTPYAFLIGISPMIAVSVNYLGVARRRLPLAIAAVAINAAIDVLLLPRIGIVAGAIGSDIAYAVYVAGHLLILRSLVDLELRPLLAQTGRALLAAAAMSLVLLAFGTGAIALPLLVIGGIVSTAVYLLALIATRALTPPELRAAGRRLRALRP